MAKLYGNRIKFLFFFTETSTAFKDQHQLTVNKTCHYELRAILLYKQILTSPKL